MKKILLLTITTLTSYSSIYTQTLSPAPIPCATITPANMNGFNGVLESYNCIEDEGNSSQTINILNGQNVTLKAGNDIILDGEVLATPDNNGDFLGVIEKSDLNVVWFDPNSSPGSVKKYEKLELGVNFPQQINDEIRAFLHYSNSNPNLATASINPYAPGLNPFDPDDIDVKAEFYYYLEPIDQ